MLQRAFPHVPESCNWRVAVVDIDQRAGGCTFRVGRPLRHRHCGTRRSRFRREKHQDTFVLRVLERDGPWDKTLLNVESLLKREPTLWFVVDRKSAHAQATRPCSCMRASDKHSSFQKVWYSGLALAAEAGLTRNARATLTPGKISPWPSDAPLWPLTVWLWAISSNLAFCMIADDRGTGRDYSFL